LEPCKLDLNKIWGIGLIILSLALIGFVATPIYQRSKVHRLTLAAGSPTGESYIVCTALRTVVERLNSRIKITILETGGTVESLKLLEEGRAALAVAQADVITGPSARIMAVLYDDTFQLVTRRESPVQTFSDLRGRTIALPRSGGQFQSFLRVAGHFGLGESDFQFIGATDASADQAFADGRADALFRVRALGNPAIQQLVRTGTARLVPIEHAAAMRIAWPAFEPAVIPAGAYLGNPAVPAENLPSVAVHRTLLAASTIDDETVRAITEALIDDRQEAAREIPDRSAEVRLLLAQARRPEVQAQLGPALHPGALKFYEKDKPSFIQAHADYIGVLITVLAMVTSWIWELRAWLQRKQKSVADDYSNRAVVLMNAAREAKSQAELEEIRGRLLGLLTGAVGDLDSDKLSEESFDSFRTILQIGLEAVRDSRNVLETARPPERAGAATIGHSV
jgi:TRAP transporter TAXI family solute receptor